MRSLYVLICTMTCLNCFSQTQKDTVIYRYIYKDTVVYNIIPVKIDTVKEEGIDLSNWGIGPYAGIEYFYSKQTGGSVGYSVGFGVSYYVWRLPVLAKKKKHKHE